MNYTNRKNKWDKIIYFYTFYNYVLGNLLNALSLFCYLLFLDHLYKSIRNILEIVLKLMKKLLIILVVLLYFYYYSKYKSI